MIEARSGWPGAGLGELWEHRDLLYFLVWRDVKVRYRATVLGAAWAVLQPLLTMGMLALLFGRLGGLQQRVGVPYPLYVYAGVLPWIFFATAVSQGALSLAQSSHLIGKVYFPRLLVPLSAVGAALADFGVSLVVMILLMLYYGAPFGASLLFAPLLLLQAVAAAAGAGALLAALSAAYRDVRHVIGFLMQFWMLASPVAYPLEAVPERWRLLYALNPVAGLVAGCRAAFLGQPLPWGPVAISAAATLGLLVAGVAYFRRVERRLADIL